MGGRVMRAGFALLDVLTIIGTRTPRKGRTIPNFFSQSFPADIPRGLGHPMRGSLRVYPAFKGRCFNGAVSLPTRNGIFSCAVDIPDMASMGPCRCRHGMTLFVQYGSLK